MFGLSPAGHGTCIAPPVDSSPPDELSPGSPERDVFLDTVTACSPDHFRPAEIHLLVTFCEALSGDKWHDALLR